MSGVPQQVDLRRRVERRRLKVIGIGTGDGDTFSAWNMHSTCWPKCKLGLCRLFDSRRCPSAVVIYTLPSGAWQGCFTAESDGYKYLPHLSIESSRLEYREHNLPRGVSRDSWCESAHGSFQVARSLPLSLWNSGAHPPRA